MVTGYNICPKCNKKYNLNRNSKNPQSYMKIEKKHICLKCCNKLIKEGLK